MAADIACTSGNQNGHYTTQLPAAPREKGVLHQMPHTQAGLRGGLEKSLAEAAVLRLYTLM